ncbi:MAG: outer membrane beta-barrel protein, partial [Candidatus Rokuibacteriota bacterium]
MGQWVPGLKASPFLSERVEYESNVFQTPSHAKDDIILKTIPGFVADYTFGPYSVSAGYRAEILRFLDLEGQDTVHHIGAAQVRADFPFSLINLRDDFTRTSEPPGTELTGRILSTTNVLTPEGEYRFTPRFSAGFKYSWKHVSFDESVKELDRDEHLFGPSVFWKIRPRADVVLNYSYVISTFDSANERDVTSHSLTLGLRGDLTAKLSSTFRVGVQRREAARLGDVSVIGYVVGGDWSYRPTERTTLTLSTDRSV